MKCSKCGRLEPNCIADPTCPRGGYCDWDRKVVRIPLNDMQTLILDLAAAIEDPCGEEECRLARVAIRLLVRTPASQRKQLAEGLEMAESFLNHSTSMTDADRERAQKNIRDLVVRMRNAEALDTLGKLL